MPASMFSNSGIQVYNFFQHNLAMFHPKFNVNGSLDEKLSGMTIFASNANHLRQSSGQCGLCTRRATMTKASGNMTLRMAHNGEALMRSTIKTATQSYSLVSLRPSVGYMRHGSQLAGINLLWLAGPNIGWDVISRNGLWARVNNGNLNRFTEATDSPIEQP